MSEIWSAWRDAGELLGVTSRRLDNGIVVCLSGELDLFTTSTAEGELKRAEEAHDVVVLDLHRLTFMDVTGLRMVIAADERLRRRSGHLRVLRASSPVQRLSELTNVDHLEMIEELPDAPVDEEPGSFRRAPPQGRPYDLDAAWVMNRPASLFSRSAARRRIETTAACDSRAWPDVGVGLICSGPSDIGWRPR